MKRIFFWVKLAIWALLFVVLFVLLYQNRAGIVELNYLFSTREMSTTLFMFLMFIAGSIFTLLVLFMLNLPTAVDQLRLRSELKSLEKEVKSLKRDQHVL